MVKIWYNTHMKMKEVRSPIESVHVRRQAGQSAQAKADELCNEHALRTVLPIMIGLLAWIFSLGGTCGWLCFMTCAIVYSAWGWSRRRQELRHWQLGAEGERCVGQILDREMPPLGYKVYHDIQVVYGKRKMNFDHVLVGKNGVYLLEDKTRSKPIRGQTEVRLDLERECVFVNGRKDVAPVREALALAKTANQYFRELTGCSVFVKPVLVFPGWFCRGENHQDSPLLILNEKTLSSFLPKHYPPSSMDPRSLALLTAKLDMVA